MTCPLTPPVDHWICSIWSDLREEQSLPNAMRPEGQRHLLANIHVPYTGKFCILHVPGEAVLGVMLFGCN